MTRGGKLRIVLAVVILAVSVSSLLWGFLPMRRETRVRPVSDLSGLGLQESRTLTLTYPPRLRAGDAGVARLVLGLDPQGLLTPAAGEEEAAPPSIYDTHHVLAEARFDLPGMTVRPGELISAPMTSGQTAVFYWTLSPDQIGQYRGTIWLYLRTVDKATGQESRETVSAQIVEIKSVDYLGFSADLARMLGLVGVLAGLLLFIPLYSSLAKVFARKGSKSNKIG